MIVKWLQDLFNRMPVESGEDKPPQLYKVKAWHSGPDSRWSGDKFIEGYLYIYCKDVEHARYMARRAKWDLGFRHVDDVFSICGGSTRRNTNVILKDGGFTNLDALIIRNERRRGIIAYSCCHHCRLRGRVFEA